jgi:hypothetical protein
MNLHIAIVSISDGTVARQSFDNQLVVNKTLGSDVKKNHKALISLQM